MYIIEVALCKDGVSSLFFSKVIEEKPLGVVSTQPPPPVQEGLNQKLCQLELGVILLNLDCQIKKAER